MSLMCSYVILVIFGVCHCMMSAGVCMQISDVDERSALILLSPPHFSRTDIDINPADFQYELYLSDNKDSKFSLVYR